MTCKLPVRRAEILNSPEVLHLRIDEHKPLVFAFTAK